MEEFVKQDMTNSTGMSPYRHFPRYEYYTQSREQELTVDVLQEWLSKHRTNLPRFGYLRDMYEGRHPINHQPKKERYKPDNRLVANNAKSIVDTFNGFFIGIPVKTICEDAKTAEYIEDFEERNDIDDSHYELSKIMSIYGSGFELLYMDENSEVCETYLTPREGFVVYDDTVQRKPIFGVTFSANRRSIMHGVTVYTDREIIQYDVDKERFTDRKPHFFNGVPLIEYIENEERQGIFEQVESLINEYEKALSEKANDVDYFADAYLKMIGLQLDGKSDYESIRANRIIHVPPMDADELNAIDIGFLERPTADETQEHLLDRLRDEIYEKSMVANLSDKDFGNSSGTALAYKVLNMSNLANTKARKFASGMNQRWKLISNLPNLLFLRKRDGRIRYKFTQNLPKNLLEEAQIASQLAGTTSLRTRLEIVSAVDSVSEEMEQIKKESGVEDYPENRV